MSINNIAGSYQDILTAAAAQQKSKTSTGDNIFQSGYEQALAKAAEKAAKAEENAETDSVQRTSTSMLNASSTKDAYNMGMEQFITLMVAQLKNQDMLNPTSDTEFVAQMAQFSSLQALSNLEQSMANLQATYTTSYATSLVGQNVVVAEVDAAGNLNSIEGTVTGVTLFEGSPIIYIGDKGYSLEQIMVVGNTNKVSPPNTDDQPEDTIPEEGEENNSSETDNDQELPDSTVGENQ